MARSRRGAGEGTWFQRTRTLPTGTVTKDWVYRITLGCDKDGKQIRRSFCGPTQSIVKAKIAQAKVRGGGSLTRKSRRTVAEYLETWLAGVSTERAGTTVTAYAQRIRAFAIPNIGKLSLDDIDAIVIARLYAQLAARGVSADNVQKLHKALRRAFNVAVGQGLISRNPTAFVPRPQHRVARRRALAAVEAGALLATVAGTELEPIVRLGIMGALRPGEIFALAWEDCDLERGVIDVRHNLRDDKGKLSVVEAKADSARRIPLEPLTVAALERRREAADREGHGSRFVFVTAPSWSSSGATRWKRPGGAHLRSNDVNAALKAACAKAGVPVITLYGLRHTAISLLAESGAHPRVAADLAGHSTTALTLDTYTHAAPAQHRSAIDGVAALIGGAK